MLPSLAQLLPQQPLQPPQGQPDSVQQLLAQLHDPALPDAIGLWPLAIGWWLALFIGVTAITILVIKTVQHKKRSLYRKLALAELNNIQHNEPAHKQIFAINSLLKRAFFSAYPSLRNEMGGTYGEHWKALLFNTCALHKLTIEEQGALIHITGEAKYQPGTTIELSRVIKASRFWIKHHKTYSTAQLKPITERCLPGAV